MKRHLLLALVAGFAAAGALRAADVASSRVEVVFDHPDNFNDIRDTYSDTPGGREYVLRELNNYVASTADQVLPAGYKLKIVFTDITLAGWLPIQASDNDRRVFKATTPPDFKFSYTVTNSSGAVVKQGSDHIRDLEYQTRLINDPALSMPLPYEKAALGDWIHENLGKL
jgi:hypothetical protein